MPHDSNLPNSSGAFQASKDRQPVSVFDNVETATEQIAVTDAATVTLTVPEHAIGAFLQFVGSTVDDRLKFTVDGISTPDDNTGYVLGDAATLHVGKSPWVPGGDLDNLDNFTAICETGDSGYIRVTYYVPK